MFTLLWSLALVAVIGTLAYHRASLVVFTAAVAATIFVGNLADITGVMTWIVFGIIALPLNVTSIRQQYFSKPALAAFRKIMPEMSSTEKDAIDAGTTWWETDLFKGSPDWKKLHHYSAPRLSLEEQAFLDGPCEELCSMIDEWEICHQKADLPEEIWTFLKENKFFAMIIKKEYGGLEFSAYAQSRVLQKLSGISSVVASTVGVPNSLGPGELLQHYGTEEQKNHYLPRLVTGEEIPCFALTSPEAGSDAGAIPDFGIVCKGQWQGEEVLGMKLTWDKRYITLAPIATVLGLAFKLQDPDGLLGEKKDLGITCALIPTDLDGVKIGRRHFPLNVPFQNGPTQANGLFVPLDFIIGGPKMAGQGWRMLVECLSVGRAITLPSNSAGGVKSMAMATGAYARIRRQFKLPIGKMEGVEEAMARIGANAYMMDAVTTLSTGAVDKGEKPSVISAICKYHLTERMRQSINDAMDIHGGKGIMLGENNYLGRGYQAAPIAITVEGANILTRNMMIYGQGAIRCHPFVLNEIAALSIEDKEEALQQFDQAVVGHIGFTISNFFRSVWLGITGARFTSTPTSDDTAPYYQRLTRLSSNLALFSDVAMAVLGGDLKRRERVSARLGDVLSHLYLASATLKRYEDEGRLVEDLPMVQWAVEDSLYLAQEALDDLLRNFPVKGIGAAMRAVIMPLGKNFHKPSDRLDHKIAMIMQTPCASRDRLGKDQYLSGGQAGLLEQTLLDIIAAEPIFDKVCRATEKRLPFFRLNQVAEMGLEANVITEEEAELLRRAEAGRLQVINVDDFDHDELVAAVQKPEVKTRKTEAA